MKYLTYIIYLYLKFVDINFTLERIFLFFLFSSVPTEKMLKIAY